VALCQTGTESAEATTVAATGDDSAASEAPAPTPKAKAKGGKKNKPKKPKKTEEQKAADKAAKAAAAAPTAAPPAVGELTDATTAVSLVASTSAVFVEDSSCANAGMGALWCAAKRKCLRAWEEPCQEYAEDEETRVQIKPGAASAATVVSLNVPIGATALVAPIAPVAPLFTPQTQVQQPIYRPGPFFTQPQVPLYAGRAPIVVNQPIVQGQAPMVNQPMVQGQLGLMGSARDSQGCVTGGGYAWCAALNQCVRSWETPCPAVANVAVNTQLNAMGPPGSQRDANGCVLGGGYSWCPALSRCVRSWETPCPAAAAAAPAVATGPLIGGQRDAGGCATGGGYTFCASLNRCVRSWETPCPA